MKSLIQCKGRGSSPMRLTFLLTVTLLVSFRLLPTLEAVNPPPDGGYDNGNTAEGTDALLNLQLKRDNGDPASFNNTAVGLQALSISATVKAEAGDNTVVGALACGRQEPGGFNRGFQNTAVGRGALFNLFGGTFDTADGFGALETRAGKENTAVGSGALNRNTNGSSSRDIAIGKGAGFALTSGNNNIYIGNNGVSSETGTIRIGNAQNRRTFVSGIRATPVAGAPVVINAAGQLGTTASSVRFKEELKSMDKASESILALEPVTFRYNKEIDPENTPQFGLVAEQVEKVDPKLVVRDQEGKPFSVRYDQVNAMLLNEFLKAQHELEQQEATIAEQQKQIEALTSGLQKVSAQLEASKPAPQVVNNP
jgi:hypothetical protein